MGNLAFHQKNDEYATRRVLKMVYSATYTSSQPRDCHVSQSCLIDAQLSVCHHRNQAPKHKALHQGEIVENRNIEIHVQCRTN